MRIRRALAESHVAAVTIAVLILWAANDTFMAVWPFVSRAISFLFRAVAILDIPYFSTVLTAYDRISIVISASYAYSAVLSAIAAALASKWVYGGTPIKVLSLYRSKMLGVLRAEI